MRNPWLDFASYQYSDRNRFKGREEDIAKFKLIMAGGTMSVLYADSGIGKTSFINAGIDPQFIEMGYFPIHVLFNEDTFIGDLDVEGWLVSNIESKFYEVIKTKDSEKESKRQIKDWYYLHSEEYSEIESLRNNLWWRLHAYKIIDQENREILKPLIVFDQFEEVFIKGKTDFLVSLFSCVERISSSTLPNTVSSVLDKLDKFEDLEIDRLHNFKILFSLRKEYLSDFDYWCNDRYSITELFQNRMLLNALTRHQAKQVICDQEDIDTLDDVADEIIEKIDDKHHDAVEPFLLSVCCSRLYEKAIHLKKAILKKEDLEYIDIKNNIIRSFYEEKISTLIPNEEHRLIFETTLVDDDGYRRRERAKCRKLESINFKKNYQDNLDKSHLIRVDTIEYEEYVEIIHDRIADVIKDNKIQHEKELLLKEQEKQRQKNIEQRKKKNLERFKSSQNVLSIKGRRIWDNKSFSFSVDNTRSNTLQNSSDRASGNRSNKSTSRSEGFGMEVSKDIAFENFGELFLDQLLNQIVENKGLCIDFQDSHSKDGISLYDIHTCDCCGKRRISSVRFYSEKRNPNEPFYTREGFYGIELSYHADGTEAERKYLCDGYTSMGIVSVKFEYNSDGLPTAVMYFDKNGMPCKHIDGNFGVLIEYNEYGNENCRWFVDEKQNKVPIYNGVYGICSQYNDEDRLISQYFINELGERIYDIYGYHGVIYEHFTDKNILHRSFIDSDNNKIDIKGYCIEELIYDEQNRVIEQRYYDKNKAPSNRGEGDFCYSRMLIGYDKHDYVKEIVLINVDGEIINKIKYTYHPSGLIATQRHYWVNTDNLFSLGASDVNDYLSKSSRGVFEYRFEYTKQGLISRISNWNYKGVLCNDTNGFKSIVHTYDNLGRISKLSFYKTSEELAEIETEYEYFDYSSCKIIEHEYIICNKTSLIDKFLKFIKKDTYRNNSFKTLNNTHITSGKLNHRQELVEFDCCEDNDFISGKQLKVRQKFDEDGNVIEQRMYDKFTEMPLSNSEGVYGWRIENSHSVNKTMYLNSTFSVDDNIYGYAIVEISHTNVDGKTCEIRKYFNKLYEPVTCEQGYHKLEILNIQEDNDRLQQIACYDSLGKPVNCNEGFHKQNCEIVEKVANENQIIFSFVDSDNKPTIHKELQYYKRVETYSKTDASLISCSYHDTDDSLINCKEGYAKMKLKQNTSIFTYFYYPFCDHIKKRYYDSDDKKVNIKLAYNGHQYQAYKIVTSLSDDKMYSIYDTKSRRLYKYFWRYSHIMIIPILTLALLVCSLYLIISELLKFLIRRANRKKKELSKCPIIIVKELNEFGNGAWPLKDFDIEPGTWVIRWNDWNYTLEENCISEFEFEFNKKTKDKSLLFYNPNEANLNRRFKSFRYYGDNIGAKLTDAEVEKNSVTEMLELLQKL